MSTYRVPTADMRFALKTLGAVQQLERLPPFAEVTDELIDAVLSEAARWTEQVLAPLAQLGDRRGTELVDGEVKLPEEIKAAYRQFVDAGWPALAAAPEFGGQGLPQLVATMISETWKSANLAFSLCPMLTQGAVEALERHASESLRAQLLPKMVSGEWTGTMNLTEPQAGSDLGAVQTRAERDGEHYRIRGRKIFITWGDHDMSENIIHLVLARTPDAPPGVNGLSMFAVPKFLIAADGSVGERNDVVTVSTEHKLGIHGSPTCVMSYGEGEGALGFLVGRENEGLRYMFTMMNRARLAVGVEGLAVAERAYQGALAYARERIQGRVPGHREAATIFHHPDVRRMLMTMKAYTEAMRGLAYLCALSVDVAESAAEQDVRRRAGERAAVLTPIVKAWSTEIGQELASLGIQVHGGMGYIEETGAAQWLRDVRITTIYEGTTGIQANDLIGRKLLADEGAAVGELLDEVEVFIASARGDARCGGICVGLERALQRSRGAVAYILEQHEAEPALAGAVAVDFLLLMGTVLGGWQLASQAHRASLELVTADVQRPFLEAKLSTALFYAEHALPRSEGYFAAICAGAASVMALSEEQFER
jgi:3-(methylsulfanyl)propanoyl-CoA dehydrogenase